jgi:lysophospholipase L1-like esterase
MTRHCRWNRTLATTLLAALPLFGACDSETIVTVSPNAVDPMFARYVSIGNSVTAGFQSGGLTAAMQMESYAVLLANQMGLTVGGEGAEFNVPLMTDPGCPPPITNIFTQERVLGLTAGDCFLRQATPEYLSNVAVPGSAVIDALTNMDAGTNPNALTTLFLGGRTQLEAAAAAEPTFVTVWMGNNDVLGAITSAGTAGDASHVTEPATFATRYASMMDELQAMGTIEGGVLIGVVQVVAAPYLTQGRAWAGFELQFDALTAPLNVFNVNANCLTFQALTATDTAWTSVPFHHGAPILVSANAKIDSVQGGLLNPLTMVPAELDCSVADVITVPEMVNLITSVTAFNTAIEAEADELGWVYLDPNALLLQLAAANPTAILPFPAFGSTDPAALAAPFGTALSIDGIHPSASAHELVANALISAINANYGTSIPAIN